MKHTHAPPLKSVLSTALAAILSLSLVLKPAYAVDPTANTVMNGGFSLDGGGAIINGGSTNGYFLESGSLMISNATLQNFSTVGGNGSGGGGGFGGALFINTGASVTLNNVNFLSNNARGGNGGVGGTAAALGGSLNNLFNSGTSAIAGAIGYTPSYNQAVDINGVSGTKGGDGANSATAFGGAGGNGANGTEGGDTNTYLIAAVTLASVTLGVSAAQLIADNLNPYTLNVGAAQVAAVALDTANVAVAEQTLIDFDKALANGQIGVGGSGGSGGQAGKSAVFYGGLAGGSGGNGGAGGQPWSGSMYANTGGAAGGDAGSGGMGGLGGFGAGGGPGGNGGTGGAGAAWSGGAIPETTITKYTSSTTPEFYEQVLRLVGQNDAGNPVQNTDDKAANYSTTASFYTNRLVNGTFHPAATRQIEHKITVPALDPGTGPRPNGLDGSGGAGGNGGFGAGAGTTGTGYSTPAGGGAGGSGYGGAIFVRSGATLRITGNALFDGNGIRGGDGQAADLTKIAGGSGIGAGSNLFMMKDSTVILDPGAGNTITFNSSPYGTGIADNSAASIIPSGGFSPIKSGDGADIHIASGLVQFNGGNLYSGQTIIEGGTLQAQDGDGIYWDSNINFAGTLTSDAVLMGNGDFTRYVGPQSIRVQWTGSGGFAAADGELNVKLSNGQTMKWASNSFVPNNSAMVFGSIYATDKVNFENNINLNGGNRTVLVTANDADPDNNVAENVDWAVFNGVISNGSLTINDANHAGKVVLAADNTYTGSTTINAGTVEITGSVKSSAVSVASDATLESTNGGLDATTAVTNNGTLNLGATNDTIASLTNTGSINGTGTLTATTYDLNNGSVLYAKLGTGTLNTAGSVMLHGTVGAGTINVAKDSTLNLTAPELILDSAAVTVNGTLNLNGGNETFQTLLGSGTVNTNANKLSVSNASGFTGTLNGPNTAVTGNDITVGGGNTDSTTVDNNLTVTAGGTLDSNTITVNNISVLDITNGKIVYDTLNGVGPIGGTINAGGTFINPFGSTVKGFLTVKGDFTNNGNLSPGASPGIFNVAGNYVENATTNMELGGLAGPGVNNVPPGSFGHDQTTVTGTVTLNTATSVLNVQAFNGFLPSQGNKFQIIATGAGGAIRATGNFSAVTFDADGVAEGGLPVTNAAVVFDVNTSAVTATGLNGPTSTFAELGSNPNQSGAATAIFNAAKVGPTSNQIDSQTIAGALALQIMDANNNSATDLAKYVPDYYGSLSDYAFMGNQVLVQSIQDRVSPMNYIPAQISEDRISEVPETMSVFFGYSYANMNTADKATASRNDYYAGVNLLASEEYVVGLAGSMSEGNIKAPLGNASSDGFGGMIFGRYTVAKSWTFFGSFGINQQSFDLTRQAVNGTTTGSTNASSYVGFLGVQYKGWRVGGVSIAPRLSFTYSDTHVAGFSESGAIDALNVGGYSNTRFIAEAGVSALWGTEIAGRPLNLEVALSVQQALQNTKSKMAVNVATVPTANYEVNFASNGDTQAVARVNASYAISKAVTAYVGYEGHFGNQTAQHAKAGLRINF
jgi:hypothetical protein